MLNIKHVIAAEKLCFNTVCLIYAMVGREDRPAALFAPARLDAQTPVTVRILCPLADVTRYEIIGRFPVSEDDDNEENRTGSGSLSIRMVDDDGNGVGFASVSVEYGSGSLLEGGVESAYTERRMCVIPYLFARY